MTCTRSPLGAARRAPTSRVARKQGLARRLTAELIAADVAAGALVKPYTVAAQATIGPAAQTGPFAHLRPEAHLEERARVGNFVETKNAVLGEGSKASHLSYLGDAEIGDGVNIGAGTITCNYDGVNKHKTIIEDDGCME